MLLVDLAQLFIGLTILVVVIYVALQVRKGTRQTNFQNHAQARLLLAQHQKLLTDPECAEIWLKGLEEPQLLSREERLRFYNIMYILVNSIELTYLNPTDSFQSAAGFVDYLGRYPGFRKWWSQARGNYETSMMEQVDKALEVVQEDA